MTPFIILRRFTREKNKMPKLTLTNLANTGIHTPTKEEFDQIRRIFEYAGWKWGDGRSLPTEQPGINIQMYGDCTLLACDSPQLLRYGTTRLVSPNRRIMSMNEFYKEQKITSRLLREINRYFDNKKEGEK